MKDEKVHSQITIRPVQFELAGVDAFRCDVKKILDYLASYLRKVINTGLLNVIGQLFLPSMIM